MDKLGEHFPNPVSVLIGPCQSDIIRYLERRFGVVSEPRVIG